MQPLYYASVILRQMKNTNVKKLRHLCSVLLSIKKEILMFKILCFYFKSFNNTTIKSDLINTILFINKVFIF